MSKKRIGFLLWAWQGHRLHYLKGAISTAKKNKELIVCAVVDVQAVNSSEWSTVIGSTEFDTHLIEGLHESGNNKKRKLLKSLSQEYDQLVIFDGERWLFALAVTCLRRRSIRIALQLTREPLISLFEVDGVKQSTASIAKTFFIVFVYCVL